jgi:hypothetical protein
MTVPRTIAQLSLLLLAASLNSLVSAAELPSTATAACGPKDVVFDVKLDKSNYELARPSPGKTLVYFIQDGSSTGMIGMDGDWIGANRLHSYFSVSVNPGEHHLCASVHSIIGNPVRLAHFTAEAGRVYYFSARILATQYDVYLFFGEEDSDQAKSQITSFRPSISTLKKNE